MRGSEGSAFSSGEGDGTADAEGTSRLERRLRFCAPASTTQRLIANNPAMIKPNKRPNLNCIDQLPCSRATRRRGTSYLSFKILRSGHAIKPGNLRQAPNS